jgi:hypothetical protein
VAVVDRTCEGDVTSFRITGLPAEEFAHLFSLSNADLAAQGGVRRTVDGNHPCPVSLADSRPGEELLLINRPTTR